MVNPRWRPEIANSRVAKKRSKKDDRIDELSLPKPEKYIGKFIKAEIDGKKLSNPSYVKYYKDIV